MESSPQPHSGAISATEAEVSQTIRIRRALGFLGAVFFGMLLGILGLAFVMAGEIYDYLDTVDGGALPSVDAIVVLAGGRGRIAGAGDLWYRYKEAGRPLPVLYVSGMGPQSTWGSMARQLRPGVREVIRKENVVLENESENTEENARWLVNYAREHNWSRILLVTSPYHMRRARFIFERVIALGMADSTISLPLAVETLSILQDPFEQGEWRTGGQGIRVTVTEYLKWVYYRNFWSPSPKLN